MRRSGDSVGDMHLRRGLEAAEAEVFRNGMQRQPYIEAVAKARAQGVAVVYVTRLSCNERRLRTVYVDGVRESYYYGPCAAEPPLELPRDCPVVIVGEQEGL